MKNFISLVQAARSSAVPGSVPFSEQMLPELVALHEEMIVQLHLEHVAVGGAADFLTGMIERHEKASAMLRALIENQETNVTWTSLHSSLQQSESFTT
jgi:hypothetical protein